ncbi:hypothetical protein [Chondromyces crocatus]|uniref:Uncharacterized protein n=1 Tax=Chondromyces crocatus TaxID=52 RepID=A0A0K1ESE0_CHOCO|nr:hypothetical protein [Chondromyces crocatus]AKT43781.1 uncharacterized protein CMC5_080170 [Chondromyces crocatus]
MLASRPVAWLSACVLLGYVAISRAVEDEYPFSTFSMYARHGKSSVSRVAARTRDGHGHPVRSFVDWSCEEEKLDLSVSRCAELGPFDFTGYLDTEDENHLDAHRARAPRGGEPGDAEPVEIVRRVWRLKEQAGPPEVEDCVLHRCTARRASP